MHKLTIPTILIATVLIAGVFALMPIEKATTVHTTIQGSQLTLFKTLFVTDTSAQNATGGCGVGNGGLAYWTVINSTLGASGTGAKISSTTFILTTDGDTEDSDEISIVLASNFTSASGTVAVIGTTAKDIIIGATGGDGGAEEVGDIILSIQCQSGDTAVAEAVTP